MAKIRINEERIICDFCGNSGYHTECLICEKDMCIICIHITVAGQGSMFYNKVCRDCGRTKEYLDATKSFSNEWHKLQITERKEIIKLRKNNINDKNTK